MENETGENSCRVDGKQKFDMFVRGDLNENFKKAIKATRCFNDYDYIEQ